MSYRAHVTPEDLESAKQNAAEMADACGWNADGDWLDKVRRQAYMDGIIDSELRALGYDVFG